MGAAAPAPHVGRHLAGQLEQVVIDEKEPAQPMPFDERQLGCKPALGLVAVRGAGGIALLEARPAQLGEGLRGRRAVGAVKVWKPVAEIPREIERPTALRQHQRGGDSFRTVTKQFRDLARRSQEKLAIGAPDLVRAVEGGAVADRDQHVVQPVPRACVIVRVARRHDAEARVPRQRDQGAGEGQVAPHVVPLQLDVEALRAEHRPTPLGEGPGRPPPPMPERPRQQAVAAAGEDDEPRVALLEGGEVEPRVAPVGAPEMRRGEQAAEVGVAFGGFGEQRDVRAVGERHLGAGDRLEAEPLRLLRERHRAVQPVVIGERERREAQLGGRERELLGQRGAVQKRERGVTMQLGVHRAHAGRWSHHAPVTRSSNSTTRAPPSSTTS